MRHGLHLGAQIAHLALEPRIARHQPLELEQRSELHLVCRLGRRRGRAWLRRAASADAAAAAQVYSRDGRHAAAVRRCVGVPSEGAAGAHHSAMQRGEAACLARLEKLPTTTRLEELPTTTRLEELPTTTRLVDPLMTPGPRRERVAVGGSR
jgi:hypothetical protein